MDESELGARAYHAQSELEYLASLVGTIIEQLDTLRERADPLLQAAVIADLARIAFDYVDLIASRLGG